jgi:hypothetical protein
MQDGVIDYKEVMLEDEAHQIQKKTKTKKEKKL